MLNSEWITVFTQRPCMDLWSKLLNIPNYLGDHGESYRVLQAEWVCWLMARSTAERRVRVLASCGLLTHSAVSSTPDSLIFPGAFIADADKLQEFLYLSRCLWAMYLSCDHRQERQSWQWCFFLRHQIASSGSSCCPCPCLVGKDSYQCYRAQTLLRLLLAYFSAIFGVVWASLDLSEHL